jgi:nucleotide-binding universal stress UspA family protein
VRLGFPSDEIEAVIEDGGADFVVMGMKGKSALEKMVRHHHQHHEKD